MPDLFYWMIFFLPLIAFVVNALFIHPFVKGKQVSAYIAISAVSLSLALSLWSLLNVFNQPEHFIVLNQISWVEIGSFSFQVGITMDSLTAIMLVVVTLVSLLVQIYSQGYMHGDPGYHRYYAWLSMFTASMIGLVLSDNLLMLYVFWEMVGLCSYLLIGFWFHRPAAANAAKKAFIATRVGDFGLLAAILVLYTNYGTFDIGQLHAMATAGILTGATLAWAAVGIFAGAAGKSAQFPLHIWLPDAMEGPTPVSALIHAATMVAAGVYLVARTLPLFEHSAVALNSVAAVGGFTAIFAASMGLVAMDIKRVLAYSTISQLGYMMLGLATGGVAVGIFHLFNHAFYKALLFLGSGSVNHASGTFDMRMMGGLRKVMPWTYALFLVGSLSLVGIWPLSGFWSKDEVLASALDKQPFLFVLALLTVFMTAFYMFRVIFLTFGGESRSSHGEGPDNSHPHESPKVMIIPMAVLGIFSVVSGFWGVGGQFGNFLGNGEETRSFLSGFLGVFNHPLTWISLSIAGLGILLAYAIYSAKWLSAENLGRIFRPVYTVLYNRYWMDYLYEKTIVNLALFDFLFARFQWFDSRIVDGIVNGAAGLTANSGKAARRTQNGQFQIYALSIGIGLVAIIACVLIFGK